MPRFLRPMPDVPLVQIPVSLVRRRFATPTVRRAAMVMDVGMLLHDGRQDPFIDMPRREGGLAEIRLLVGVIQLEVRGFGELIVYMKFQWSATSSHGNV